MKILFSRSRRRPGAFSLIELMVSVAVLSIMLVIVFQMLEQMQKTWKRTRQNVTEFKDARSGFEEMSRRLGQATTNSYYGYRYERAPLGGQSAFYGREIVRQSELHFVSGPSSTLLRANKNPAAGPRPTHSVFFQAPFGFCFDRAKKDNQRLEYEHLNSLLNAWGYFVEFNTDEMDRPSFLNELRNAPQPRPRYRLMEFRQPTEYLQIYKLNLRDMTTKNQAAMYEWFSKDRFSVNSDWNTKIQSTGGGETFFRTTRPVAENIIGMIILPRYADTGTGGRNPWDLAPDYLYDTRRWQWSTANSTQSTVSRHALPPIIDVTFIAVDEASFSIYATRAGIKSIETDPDLIKDSEFFTKAQDFQEDLQNLEIKLRALGLEFRVFSTSIRLREARWEDN